MEYPAKPPVIETTRLRLRPFTPADAAAVQQLAGERTVAATTRLIPHPYPDGAAEAWIATHPARWTAKEELVLALSRHAQFRMSSIDPLASFSYRDRPDFF